MDTSGNFSGSVEVGDGFSGSSDNSSLRINLESSHGVMDNRGDLGNVIVVFHLEIGVMEESFSVGIGFFGSIFFIFFEGSGKMVGSTSDFFC